MYSNIEETCDVIGNYSPDKLIFWVGAGIDFCQPTCLPLGEKLTKFIIRQACGDEIGESIISAWTKTTNRLNTLPLKYKAPSVPRLETVVEVIRNIEEYINFKYSIIKGLSVFNDSFPNDTHYLLAYYLHEGANIITTNFDNCIPKAYNEIFKNESEISLAPERGSSGVYVYQSTWTGSGKIYHIHGVANDYHDLGTSLRRIKNGFPSAFKELLLTQYKNACCQVYLGYSGSDSLDVNVFFKELSPSPSMGIYIAHTNNPGKTVTDSEKNEKIETVLHPFEDKIICSCKTSDFIDKLRIANPCSLTALTDINKLSSSQSFDFESAFATIITPYPRDLKYLTAAKMIYELGLNVNLIFHDDQWEKIIENTGVVDKSYRYMTLTNVFRIVENIKKIEYYGKSVYTEEELSAITRKKTKTIDQFIPPSKVLEDIQVILQQNGEITWNYSNSLNRRTRKLLFSALNPFYRPSPETTIEIDLIAKSTNLINKAGYKNVTELNQVNTSLRVLGAIQIAFKNDFKNGIENFNNSFENYFDISSMRGILSTLFYSELSLLPKGLYTRNKDLLRRGIRHLYCFMSLKLYGLKVNLFINLHKKIAPGFRGRRK